MRGPAHRLPTSRLAIAVLFLRNGTAGRRVGPVSSHLPVLRVRARRRQDSISQAYGRPGQENNEAPGRQDERNGTAAGGGASATVSTSRRIATKRKDAGLVCLLASKQTLCCQSRAELVCEAGRFPRLNSAGGLLQSMLGLMLGLVPTSAANLLEWR